MKAGTLPESAQTETWARFWYSILVKLLAIFQYCSLMLQHTDVYDQQELQQNNAPCVS